MNILLVYPKFLATFWSWQYLLDFISKKSAFAPLGLLTVASMLPKNWAKKLVDLNVQKLSDDDIREADYVFIGAMIAQQKSAREVIGRCHKLGKPVVLGGPIVGEDCEKKFHFASHFLQGEAENTLSGLLRDLQNGTAKRVYKRSEQFPDLAALTYIPDWSLVNLRRDYVTAMIQYCRGCPYNCAFCNIADINGRLPRAKTPEQFLLELDAIYRTGFRGPVFVTDDNFIGNKNKTKELLRRLIVWQQQRRIYNGGYPFEFTAEVDITLADDPELMRLMAQAGFNKVFLGIETPNPRALRECEKTQNLLCRGGESRDLVGCVRKIQSFGLQPMSGFIVGFDSDDPLSFVQEHLDFYLKAGIVFPMTGVLQAIHGTALEARLRREGRMSAPASGNNTDCYPNFIPKMPVEVLAAGYRRLMKIAYSPKEYYKRIRAFLDGYDVSKVVPRKSSAADIRIFIKSVLRVGIFGGLKTSYYYWKTLAVAALKHPKAFSEAVKLQIYGMHFRQVAKNI